MDNLSSAKLLSLNTATTSTFSLSDKKLENQDRFGSWGELAPPSTPWDSDPSYLFRWNRGDTTRCFIVLDSFLFQGDPGWGAIVGGTDCNVDDPWTTLSVPA